MRDWLTFRIIGSKESPVSKGVEIILPDGQEVGKYFPVTSAKIEARNDEINLVTISFYAKLQE
jgi:hypothetical protein